MHNNSEFEQAMLACHQSSNKDFAAFESCMKAKGFEKPAGMPPMPNGQHPMPTQK